MKFLLFQFALYAAFAMAVGGALVAIWSRTRTLGLRRALDRSQQALTYERESNARLRASRMADHKLIGEATDLASKLLELRSALALVEADVRANQMARAEAERARENAVTQLEMERGFASRSTQLSFELRNRIHERDALKLELQTVVRSTGETVQTLQARNDDLSLQLASLRSVHDAFVVESQTSLSAAEIRAEDAAALAADRRAENQQLLEELRSMGPSRVIVLPESLDGVRP